jgi:ankyrin repeat protein
VSTQGSYFVIAACSYLEYQSYIECQTHFRFHCHALMHSKLIRVPVGATRLLFSPRATAITRLLSISYLSAGRFGSQTSIVAAALFEAMYILVALFEAHASYHETLSRRGMTPLMWAARNGHIKASEQLTLSNQCLTSLSAYKRCSV